MMKALSLFASSTLLLGAAPPQFLSPPDEGLVVVPPTAQLRELGPPKNEICRDRIHLARAENDLPKLDPETVSPENPYLIAAVEQQIDGCSVMVMHNDKADFRPIPPLPEEPMGFMRAR